MPSNLAARGRTVWVIRQGGSGAPKACNGENDKDSSLTDKPSGRGNRASSALSSPGFIGCANRAASAYLDPPGLYREAASFHDVCSPHRIRCMFQFLGYRATISCKYEPWRTTVAYRPPGIRMGVTARCPFGRDALGLATLMDLLGNVVERPYAHARFVPDPGCLLHMLREVRAEEALGRPTLTRSTT